MRLLLDTPDFQPLKGFAYFWMKRVEGFDDTKHCAKCLKGEYVNEVSAELTDGAHMIAAEPGQVFYLCGVAKPYRWENNAHLAMRAAPDCSALLTLYTGALVRIDGAVQIPFDDTAARELYPTKAKAYLTCRNFQFGATMRRLKVW